MLRNRRERGEGNFGCLVGLVVLLLAGLIAYKMIPVKVKAAEMRDAVVDESRSAATHNDGQIRKALMHKATTLELPVVEDQIKIERNRGEIRIELEYTVPVQFPGYTYNWRFHHKAENPLF